MSILVCDFVLKLIIRFNDISGTVYIVFEVNIVVVSFVMWFMFLMVDCLFELMVCDGVCDLFVMLNNCDGCWDGGDCC